MNNTMLSGNIVLQAVESLRLRLPFGWNTELKETGNDLSASSLRIVAPDRSNCTIKLLPRRQLDPKDVAAIAELARLEGASASLVLVSRYLSEATRQKLIQNEIGYLDLTGNVRLVLTQPGLFIETQGATKDPDRKERPARTLRGAKAGRVVRLLVDRRTPAGVREIADATGVDKGYVSRVLALLDKEALITRTGRGRVEDVDWSALLRRWANDAPLTSRGTMRTYLEPRGLSTFLARLATTTTPYAITASLAVPPATTVAPPRLATVWVSNVIAAAHALELRPAESGANIMLIEPSDDAVFDRAAMRNGLRYVALSQVAADLLTSPGRGPAEAESLMEWMRANETEWRT